MRILFCFRKEVKNMRIFIVDSAIDNLTDIWLKRLNISDEWLVLYTFGVLITQR